MRDWVRLVPPLPRSGGEGADSEADITTEEQALLAAVVADPDNDLPRLLYADWCDDHGRPDRAELIRVQIGRATTRRTDRDGRAALGRRQSDLLREHGRGWRNGLPNAGGRLRWGEFRRGFPDHIDLRAVSPNPPGLYDALAAGLATNPVRVLEATVRDMPAVHRLLDWPGLDAVPELRLWAVDYSWEQAGWGPELAERLTTRDWGRQPVVVGLRYWHFDAVPLAVWERLAGRPGPVFRMLYCWFRTAGDPPAFAASGGRLRWWV